MVQTYSYIFEDVLSLPFLELVFVQVCCRPLLRFEWNCHVALYKFRFAGGIFDEIHGFWHKVLLS